LKNLFCHKAKALMVVVPLTIIIAIVSGFTFFMEGVEHDALLAVKHSPDILLQQQVGGRTESMYFNRYDNLLQEIDTVKAYFPRSWGYINFPDPKNNDKTKAFVVMGLEPNHIKAGRLIDAAIETGRALIDKDVRKGIIGKAMAKAFKCRVGDTILVSSPGLRDPIPIEVVGIFTSEVQIYTADLLLTDRWTANEILGFLDEDECSDIVIFLKNPAMADVVAQKILSKVSGARPMTRALMQSLTEQSFGQKSGFFHLLWFILLVNVIIIAWSLLGQISFNLKKEIGILKAVGWDTGDIMALKTFETLVIAFLSVLSGLLIGILYMVIDAPGLKRFVIGWADIYPDFPVPLYIEWTTVALIVMLGILPLMAGTIVPIWRIGTIDPDEAIRL
jgi:ABC-type lipoprotein release transport system permease subunit